MRTNRTGSVISVLAAVVAAAPVVHGQNYSTDFSQGDGDWTRFQPLAPFGAGGTYTFPATGGYRIQAPPSPDPAGLGVARVGSIAPSAADSTTDFVLSVDLIDFGLSGERMVAGLGFHGGNLGLGTTDSYALFIFLNPATNETTLRFNRITNETAVAIGDAQTFPGIAPVRLVVRGVGNSYTGQALDLDTGALLAEAAATDSTYAGGFTGLLITGQVGQSNPPLDTTFANFSISEGSPSCPADLNGDGVVDADDFFLFLQLFAAGDPMADINGDGVIDADDFFEYLSIFAQGC